MNTKPLTPLNIITHPIHCLSFGLGLGLAPFAPGTFGTLLGIPLFLLLVGLPLPIYVLITVALFFFGIYLCGETARALNKHDHPGIVWDEVVGFLLTMVALPNHWLAILLGFVLFRFFDIVKPWPIGFIDRIVKGGLGIMIDDVVAGLFAALLGGVVWHYGAPYFLNLF